MNTDSFCIETNNISQYLDTCALLSDCCKNADYKFVKEKELELKKVTLIISELLDHLIYTHNRYTTKLLELEEKNPEYDANIYNNKKPDTSDTNNQKARSFNLSLKFPRYVDYRDLQSFISAPVITDFRDIPNSILYSIDNKYCMRVNKLLISSPVVNYIEQHEPYVKVLKCRSINCNNSRCTYWHEGESRNLPISSYFHNRKSKGKYARKIYSPNTFKYDVMRMSKTSTQIEFEIREIQLINDILIYLMLDDYITNFRNQNN